MNSSDIVRLLIAALGGAAVGLERQWSGHADGPGARFAGIRTFTMLGAVGGFSGWLWTLGVSAPAAVLLAGGVAIIAAAYVAGSRHDIDATTEVVALVVLAAGVLAGIGSVRLASGIIAIATLLLVEKSRLHALVKRIDDVGLRSGVRFAVMALVILPLLPEGPYGPLGGVRPRELWALVLFFSGLSFAGYVARRLVGPGHGYLVTGLLGGLVSSTNVTFTFARTSRADPALDRGLAFGAVAANAMLYPRVLVVTSILNSAVVPPLAPYLIAPALVAALVAAFGVRQSSAPAAPEVSQSNPLQLAGALQMAALFQIVLMAVYAARQLWGTSGVFTSAAVLGLTDVDALTLSMSRDVAETVSPAVAATAIAIGVLTNTAMKLGLTVALGSRRFKTIAGGALALMLVALGATLAGGLVRASEQAPIRIRVLDYPRPVSAAVLQIERHFGRVITYEDTRYVHPDDIVDVTEQVRRDGQMSKLVLGMRSAASWTTRVCSPRRRCDHGPRPLLVVQPAENQNGS